MQLQKQEEELKQETRHVEKLKKEVLSLESNKQQLEKEVWKGGWRRLKLDVSVCTLKI